MPQGPRLSVSTWSLHRTLGQPPIYGPDDGPVAFSTTDGALSLLDLPAKLDEFGIHTLEICHFHLPSQTPDYLQSLRTALDDAGIELFSLLIDGGDISDERVGDRDLAWTERWLDIAVQLGARCARVSAGRSALTRSNVARSRAGFERLIAYIADADLRLMTENWHALLSNAGAVHELLDPLEGRVGLCADFGNWTGPDKYRQLAAIMPMAESCHTKCTFSSQTALDREDYVRCLDLAQAVGFHGPHTLIYDGPGADEWLGLDLERSIVAPYLGLPA